MPQKIWAQQNCSAVKRKVTSTRPPPTTPTHSSLGRCTQTLCFSFTDRNDSLSPAEISYEKYMRVIHVFWLDGFSRGQEALFFSFKTNSSISKDSQSSSVSPFSFKLLKSLRSVLSLPPVPVRHTLVMEFSYTMCDVGQISSFFILLPSSDQQEQYVRYILGWGHSGGRRRRALVDSAKWRRGLYLCTTCSPALLLRYLALKSKLVIMRRSGT